MRFKFSLLSINRAIVVLSIALLTFSCTQNSDDNKSDCLLTYLRMVTIEEDNLGIDEDTTYYKFNYNSDGELIQQKIDDDLRYELIYDGDGKLWKIEEYYFDDLSDYYLLTWDGNQETYQRWFEVDGVFKPSNQKNVFHYSNENQIDKIENYHLNDNNEWSLSGFDIFIYENSNMVRMESYDTDSVLDFTTIQYYDDKRNPLRNIHAYWFVAPSYFFYSQNNTISVTEEGYTTYFNWTYDNNDYPTLMTSDYQDGEYTDHFELSFEYDCD